MANKDKATCLLTTSILPKDIRAAFNGRNSFTPESTSYKWVYLETAVGTSSSVLFTSSSNFVGTVDTIDITADKALWIAIKHTGTTNKETKTVDGLVFSIDAGTAAYDLVDGNFLGPNELFVAKYPNTLLNKFTAASVSVLSGLPTGVGNGNVQLQIAALVKDAS